MSSRIDRAGDVSTTEPAAVSALQDFTDRLLGLRQGMEAILDAVRTMPDEPSLQIAAAFFWLFGQTPDAQEQAAQNLAAARLHADRLEPREQAWLRALDLWQAKSFDAAARIFEDVTARHPEDLTALRAAEFLYYVMGQQYSGARFFAHTTRLADQHAADPDFLAMHAFASELSDRPREARAHAEKAIDLREINPWAQHALEHVLLWEGNTEAAAALMDDWLAQWSQVARTVHCHNAWHVALMHLDRLENLTALRVFKEHVWEITPTLVVEQLDAIAFLWRAEMAGIPVQPDQWAKFLPYIEPLCETLFMPFSTAHYAYALARAGDSEVLNRLLAAVEARATESDPEALRVWKPAGRGIVRAAACLGQDRAAEAAEAFEPAMPFMTRIGGSDAQDDLFRFAFVDSLARSGRRADAAAYLQERLALKPASPLEKELAGRLV